MNPDFLTLISSMWDRIITEKGASNHNATKVSVPENQIKLLQEWMPLFLDDSRILASQLIEQLECPPFDSKAQEKCRVAVVGRFKAGKSYLINSLIGADVLPFNTAECTSAVTIVGEGDRLTYLNVQAGIETEITREAYELAVDQTKSEIEKAAFTVLTPSAILKHISIMDTPGYGGAASFKSEENYKAYVDECIDRASRWADLCVIAVTETKIGEQVAEFGKRVLAHCPKVLFVVNRSDDMGTMDVEDIARQIETETSAILGVQLPVFFVSAKWERICQSDDEEDVEARKAILRKRRISGWNGSFVHEWEDMVMYLVESAYQHQLERSRAEFRRIHAIIETMDSLARTYDPVQFATKNFLSLLPKFEDKLENALGPKVRNAAIVAAESGRPLPWERLEGFGIRPTTLVPESLIDPNLRTAYLAAHHTIARITLAEATYSEDAEFLIFLLKSISGIDSGMEIDELREAVTKRLKWLQIWEAESFDYYEAQRTMRERWANHSQTKEIDIAESRRKLELLLTNAHS